MIPFKLHYVNYNYNNGKIFISNLAYVAEVNSESIQKLDGQLYKACIEYDYHFVNNDVALHRYFWTD